MEVSKKNQFFLSFKYAWFILFIMPSIIEPMEEPSVGKSAAPNYTTLGAVIPTLKQLAADKFIDFLKISTVDEHTLDSTFDTLEQEKRKVPDELYPLVNSSLTRVLSIPYFEENYYKFIVAMLCAVVNERTLLGLQGRQLIIADIDSQDEKAPFKIIQRLDSKQLNSDTRLRFSHANFASNGQDQFAVLYNKKILIYEYDSGQRQWVLKDSIETENSAIRLFLSADKKMLGVVCANKEIILYQFKMDNWIEHSRFRSLYTVETISFIKSSHELSILIHEKTKQKDKVAINCYSYDQGGWSLQETFYSLMPHEKVMLHISPDQSFFVISRNFHEITSESESFFFGSILNIVVDGWIEFWNFQHIKEQEGFWTRKIVHAHPSSKLREFGTINFNNIAMFFHDSTITFYDRYGSEIRKISYVRREPDQFYFIGNDFIVLHNTILPCFYSDAFALCSRALDTLENKKSEQSLRIFEQSSVLETLKGFEKVMVSKRVSDLKEQFKNPPIPYAWYCKLKNLWRNYKKYIPHTIAAGAIALGLYYEFKHDHCISKILITDFKQEIARQKQFFDYSS